MAKKNIKDMVESKQLKAERLKCFKIGDSVDVHVKITEGEKERIQIFSGIVIARRGSGLNESFTVRRLVGTEGVERVWPVHSPSLEKIEVKKGGKTRRAKLYYLRDRVGKATRLAEDTADAVKPRLAEAKAAAAKAEAKAEAAK